MIRKYHNHTLQTNPLQREEEPQKTNSHKTSGRQLKYKATSPLLPIMLIAKQENILITT